ncbi:MAG: cell division FtsZ family protein [Muribaculaceae bacterium]|nr:cell division FtsZ family protein [Muribaculaceae bacterium]
MADPEDSNLLNKLQSVPAESVAKGPIIIAMGVGGGGGNAVNYMWRQGIQGVEFVALNTDFQVLDLLEVPTKLLLGPKLCGGNGAGGVASVGAAAAQESAPDIERLVDRHVDMVFVTAGMGGGTGTGAAPVVAKICKDRDILTIGIVTIPFFFEGTEKLKSALDGAAQLKQTVDALLVINNDRLGDIYPDIEWGAAFEKADDILAMASRSISEMVTTPAMINIDMRDVDTTLRNGRTAFISVGFGEGENRMSKAIQSARHSPLLCDTDLLSARRLLFAFYYSHEIDPPFRVTEVQEINKLVAEMNKGVKVIFGWGYDDSLGNSVKFTILASGFDVTVEHGAGDTVIEGVTDDKTHEKSEIDSRIVAAYGSEKVNEFIRQQETQNYYILSPDQLDSDEAIDMLEKNPAFKRDKRKAQRADSESARKPAQNNEINFSLDDR